MKTFFSVDQNKVVSRKVGCLKTFLYLKRLALNLELGFVEVVPMSVSCLNTKSKLKSKLNILIQQGIRISFLMGMVPLTHAADLSEGTVNINPLRTGLNASYLGLEDASLYDQAFIFEQTKNRVAVYATLHHEENPWIVLSEDKSQRRGSPVITAMDTLDLSFSWLVSKEFQISYSTFISKLNPNSDFETTPGQTLSKDGTTQLGDSNLQFKFRLYQSRNWSFALIPELTIPTGPSISGYYGAGLSDNSNGYGVKIASEYVSSSNRYVFNLGVSRFEKSGFAYNNGSYPKVEGVDHTFLGLGWLHRISKYLALDTEISYDSVAGVDHFTPPGLATMGFRYQATKSISYHFGGGTGLINPHGGNNGMLYLGIKIPLLERVVDKVTVVKYIEKEPEENDSMDKLLPELAPPPPTPTPVPPPPPPTPVTKPYTEEELKEKVVYKKNSRIETLDEIEFVSGRSDLTFRGQQLVDRVAVIIKENQKDISRVDIDGHTDHIGGQELNDVLSQKRAQTVYQALINQGVSPTLLNPRGFGSRRPLYNPATKPEELWGKNRRVEFNIIPR